MASTTCSSPRWRFLGWAPPASPAPVGVVASSPCSRGPAPGVPHATGRALPRLPQPTASRGHCWDRMGTMGRILLPALGLTCSSCAASLQLWWCCGAGGIQLGTTRRMEDGTQHLSEAKPPLKCPNFRSISQVIGISQASLPA